MLGISREIQAGRQAQIQREMQTCMHAGRQIQREIQTDRKPDRHADRQIQRKIQTGRHADT